MLSWSLQIQGKYIILKSSQIIMFIFFHNLMEYSETFNSLPYFAINPCHAEYIKKPHPLLIFSQSDYLIQSFFI